MSAASSFVAATAVEAIGDPDETTGRATFTSHIAEGWDIAGNANGGYLLAIAGRALQAATGRADPVSVTGHYLAPGRTGPVRIETTVHKRGRAFSTATATVVGADRTLLVALGAFGELGDATDTDTGATGAGATGNAASAAPRRVDALPPELPALEECVAVHPTETFPPPFMGRIELRAHPDDAGFVDGRRSGEPLMRGWFRLADGEPLDTVALLVAVDALPPTIFNTDLPVAWTPTVELTAHVRSRPDPGAWLRCAFRTRFITGGFLEEDGEVWDERGEHLVAQSRQLALVPRG